jgi:hypothetical protein
MPRRKSEFDELLDDLLEFLRVVPWWVGPPVILFAWLLFTYQPVAKVPNSVDKWPVTCPCGCWR